MTKFGVQLPNFSGFDPSELFGHVAGLATTAEEAGFDSVWVTGDDVSFSGSHYRLDHARNLPRPVQAGGPRIMIGGGGEKRTLRLVARYADMRTGLVTRARTGDRQAWDQLVDRYAPLVWSICRRHRLEAADAQDAAQTVWLTLVDHLDSLRDPAALPGWVATTTRRECGRTLRAARRPYTAAYALAAETIPDEHARAAEQDLLAAERHAALREAFGQLPPAASTCSPCSPPTRRCRMPRSAPSWASRSAASGRPGAAAWTSCAATRPSPR
jgi:RNA polymerase sigma factor (sigma-70 family)